MPIIRTWVFFILLAVLTSLLYAPFLNNPIVFDDMHFFIPDGGVDPVYAEWHPFSSRWLPYITIAWTVNIFGMNLLPLRIESLVLHCLVGVSLFLFITQLYRRVLGKELHHPKGLPVIWGAFFATLLFLLNPVAVYAAAYLVQRTIVMATLFSLWALLAYMHGLHANKRLYLWLSAVLYLLAVLAKPHALMLPAVLFATTVLLRGLSSDVIKKVAPVFVGYFAIALYIILQSKGIFGVVYEPNADDMLARIEVEHAYLYSVLTQGYLFFKYLFLWIVPNPEWMSVDMREPFAQRIFSFEGLGALGFLIYGIFAIKLLFKRGVLGIVGFALLFPWLLFFTELSVVRIQEPFVLYRSYFWMTGLAILLPLAVYRLESKFISIVLLVLALIFAALSIGKLVTFSHRFLLWDDAARLIEGKKNIVGEDRIYANRGQVYKDMLRYPEAIADLKKSISLRPNFGYYHHSIAVAYLEIGEYTQSIAEFERAIELSPENMRAYYGIGLAYRELKKMDLAKKNFSISCNKGLKQGCDKMLVI